MRIIGFTKQWDKLNKEVFTTFRSPRKDKDWQEGEYVQVVYHPRHHDRKIYGAALIIKKTPTFLKDLTDTEAIEDGFENAEAMRMWLTAAHKQTLDHAMNKLTLKYSNNPMGL